MKFDKTTDEEGKQNSVNIERTAAGTKKKSRRPSYSSGIISFGVATPRSSG